ncbi:WYL domain-containing protein [Paenibacillus sp. ATY16]|nr:WYL domain-containing protein [Paenibacillus sp. ATY16]
MLRSGKRMTAKQLAKELEIHVRTVYRCIDSLCASGVPIIADSGPNGGYSILSRFTDSPLFFDIEEQKALIHASIFAKEAGYPYSDDLTRAMDKMMRYANEKQLDHLKSHSTAFSVIYPRTDGVLQLYLQMLEAAAGQGRTVEMQYDRGKGEAPLPRLFDPYGIVNWKGNWYTVGYCGYRKKLRSGSAKFETVRIKGQEQILNELCHHWLFGHALVERVPEEAVFQLEHSMLQTYVPYFLMPYSTALQIESELLIGKMVEANSRMLAHYEAMLANSTRREEDVR